MVQSSSATLGITISLAFQGVISYETAAALVLGENVGTTITAFLASLGATTNARRAAYFHVLFNLVGVFWITLLFPWYIDFVQWIVNADISTAVLVDGVATYPNTTPAIAATHSIFNIANVVLFIPFVPALVTLLERVVPAKEFKEQPHLTDLDVRMLDTPTLAIEQSHKELERMGDGCEKMLRWLSDLRGQEDPDAQLANRLQRRETHLDSIQDEISVFITKLLSGTVPHSVADEARRQLCMADEYESVSDYVADLERFDRKLRQSGHRFSQTQRQGLDELNSNVLTYLEKTNEALRQDNQNCFVESAQLAKRVRSRIKQFRRQHLEELSSGEVAPSVNVAVLAALNAYVRVLDHSENIAEAISGVK
jgi:phosphate:Na+ symporter